jgi:hypothetical protein
MLITLKRTFVYFLIVNYLQLTLMPSFVFAMEKDEILQALPRLEPIKPSSVEERDGWELPAVLSPAIASKALPVLTISLHRQENGSFQLKMQQTGAAVYSEFLPKGKIAKDYQGHKIDLNLGDALTTQVVFTTINPVCNYLFDIDGHLNLGGSLETEGYFKVQKANSFSLPANLLADSGLFLDNIKTLTQEGSTAPRVIAKRGAIDIRAAGDNKPLELKAVLEARTGIRIEADTGDLVIASDIKTPSTIFLKSKGNTLLKKTSLIGVGGIEITSAGTVMSSEGLLTLLTNKLLGVTAKRFDLKAGHYVGLEGIHLQASSLKIGNHKQFPQFQTNGNIVVKSPGEIELLLSSFQAGGDLSFIGGCDIKITDGKFNAANIGFSLETGTTTIGSASTAPQLTANKAIGLRGKNVLLRNGELIGTNGISVYATHGLLEIGSSTTCPVIKSNQSLRLHGNKKTLIHNAEITSLAGIRVAGTQVKLGCSAKIPIIKTPSTLEIIGDKLEIINADLTGLSGIDVTCRKDNLILGNYPIAPFNTNNLLTLNACGGLTIHKPFVNQRANIKINTASKGLALGEKGKAPVDLYCDGTFSFSGNCIGFVNGNILSRGEMKLESTQPLTLGGSILIKQGQKIDLIGTGQYLMTLAHLNIKAPAFKLIGSHLGARTAHFDVPILTNIGGFIDIKGNTTGTITSLMNQILGLTLDQYKYHGGKFENYRDSCLKKLPRGRVQIGGNLTLPQLVNGINLGSDWYVAGKLTSKTLIQDQIYSQVVSQIPFVPGTDFGFYLLSAFPEQGLLCPSVSEYYKLTPYMEPFIKVERTVTQQNDFKRTIEELKSERRYNQSLQIHPTHSYGKGLVVPFQDQVIVHGTLQTPNLAIAANSLVIGRQLQDFEAKLKPFTKVQDLSNFQVPTQLAIFTPTDQVALIHPPHLFRIDPKTLPPAVIISPNRLYLNPTLPRQYDPWFEIQQVMSAIQANLNRGYLDESTTQPEAIYHQLLKNAQDLYQQYQDQGKGKIPALQGVSQSIVFKQSGTLELEKGKKIALTKPVLIYEEVALNGINSLRGSLVWPPAYEQATKSIRDNRGGIMGDEVLVQAKTLQIDGRLHGEKTGAYQTQSTIINGGTLSSGKDSTTVLQAQKLLVMQPTERVNEQGIKETVFAKVESQGRTGIEAGVMEIKAGKISSTSTDPKAMLLRGNNAHLGSVKTIHAIENGTKETAEVTTISSKGGTTLLFRQSLVGEAPSLEGKNLKVTAPKIEMLPVTLRQEQQWTEIKKGWWKDTEKTIHKIIETNILPHYKADETITFIGNQTHTAPKIDAPKTVLTSSTGTVSLKLAPQNRQELIAEKSSSLVFNKQKIERQDHLTYLSPQITGDLSIEARKAIVETVEGLISPKMQVKGTLTNSILSEVHNVDVKSSRTLSGLVAALTALAITVGTGGSGSLLATGLGLGGNTLVIGAGQALVTGTATQFTLGTLNNDFDPVKGIASIGTKEGSLSLATSIVSSGIMGSMGITAPGYNASMTDITRYVGTKTLVSSGINLAFNNNSLEETLRKGGINFVTDIVGVMGANYLGELYQNGKGSIDFATHKILHGVLGAGLGALKGDPLAGALGGMVAETVADFISDDVEDIAARIYEKAESQGIEFGSQAYNDIARQEVQATVNWSKVGAILAVSLAKRDIDVGVDVATNALENNFLPMVIGAVYVANLAMTTYDAYEAYQEDGVEGVVESVATDVVMGAMTGGAFKIIGKGAKVAWKGTTQKALKNEGKNSAKNIANHEKYKEGLKQEQRLSHQSEKAAEQLNELKAGQFEKIAGTGSKGEKLLIDESRLISEYGGKSGDWNKITSKNSYRNDLGQTVETHAYLNNKTGEIVEPKLKFQGGK